MTRIASILIPAHDEAGSIGPCLGALLASDRLPEGWAGEVIVIANGCRDDTAGVARRFAGNAAARGWTVQVIELTQGGKLNALNAGDAAAGGELRLYLDADVTVAPGLIGQLVRVLERAEPGYASGSPVVTRAGSWITRAYAGFWQRLPFVTRGVPGFGIFAINGAGRARWGDWPDIISDDTFARLHFTPAERCRVPAQYRWPMVEGFANLVRVRRRQDAGVAEIVARYPQLLANDDKVRLSAAALAALALRHPVGFCVYATVAVAVRTPLWRSPDRWARGR